jgi:hypothetical protein
MPSDVMLEAATLTKHSSLENYDDSPQDRPVARCCRGRTIMGKDG